MGDPVTLAIDIGGTGLKASVLDGKGALLHDRVRVPTTYPLPPQLMIEKLSELVAPLGGFDRVSVGFPGVVRENHVRTAPHFVTTGGPGTPVDPKLLEQWTDFDLGGAAAQLSGRPVRVINDADLQGLAVVQGKGVEAIITLGTGFGSAFFSNGHLGVHFELAHARFRKSETYNQQLGDATRKAIGNARWSDRVAKAIASVRSLVLFDHLYLGGGNTKHLRLELEPDVSIVDTNAGILGGVALWDGRGRDDFATSLPS